MSALESRYQATTSEAMAVDTGMCVCMCNSEL
jgi:hypothetical protein